MPHPATFRRLVRVAHGKAALQPSCVKPYQPETHVVLEGHTRPGLLPFGDWAYRVHVSDLTTGANYRWSSGWVF